MKYWLITALLIAPTFVHAALFQSVLLTASPEHPQPGAEVHLTATLIGDDPKGSDFVWEVDGEIVGQGSNLTTLTVTAPAAGVSREILVTVFRNGAEIGSAALALRPATVTIEWEARGARPPFYTGRPLPTARGGVTAVAVPTLVRANGGVVASKDILYTWRIDDRVDSRSSGFGRDTIRVVPPFFNEPYRLSVTATTRDGSLGADGSVVIVQRTPDVVFYEISPLAGLRDERAVAGSYAFTTDEVSFKAYPLHVEDPASLSATWTLNGDPLQLETGDQFLAVFRKTGAGSGSYEVGLSFSHAGDFLRRASSLFLLTF